MSVPNLKWIALFLQKLLGDVRRKSNENCQFSHPRVFNAPADGVPLGILYRRSWSQKTRMMGLSDGGKSFRIRLAVLIQYRSVTDTQPATQPRCRSYYAQRSGVEPKKWEALGHRPPTTGA